MFSFCTWLPPFSLRYIYLYLTASALCDTGQTIQNFLYLDLFSALYMASSVLTYLSSANPPPPYLAAFLLFSLHPAAYLSVLPALYFIYQSLFILYLGALVQVSIFLAAFVSAL
jgi:hypothetical protein